MNYYKKYSLFCVITPIALFLMFIGIMLVADPLQIFHRSYFKEHSLEENMRQQAAGIIKSFDFDSIIIGNSYMENTSAKVCDELFHGTFANLSLGGSSNFERAIVLNYALKHKKIHTVINVIDTNTNKTGSQSYPFELWSMLYDENPFNDFRVYFDLYYFGSIFAPARNVAWERPNAWHTDPWYTSRLGGIDNWIKNADNRQVARFLYTDFPDARKAGQQPSNMLTEKRKAEIRDFIQDVMGQQAIQYPETRFIYIFPPFSRLFFSFHSYKGNTEEYYFWHQAMVEASEKWKNIEIYVFADQEYVDNIANYIDPNHFDEWINTSMMQSIAKGEGRLTAENLSAYTALVKDKAQNFDFEKFVDYIIENLKK